MPVEQPVIRTALETSVAMRPPPGGRGGRDARQRLPQSGVGGQPPDFPLTCEARVMVACRMRTILATVLLAALVLPMGAEARWGEKSRSCPRWTAQLAAVEQAGEAETRRGKRLRNRVTDYCVAMNE